MTYVIRRHEWVMQRYIVYLEWSAAQAGRRLKRVAQTYHNHARKPVSSVKNINHQCCCTNDCHTQHLNRQLQITQFFPFPARIRRQTIVKSSVVCGGPTLLSIIIQLKLELLPHSNCWSVKFFAEAILTGRFTWWWWVTVYKLERLKLSTCSISHSRLSN